MKIQIYDIEENESTNLMDINRCSFTHIVLCFICLLMVSCAGTYTIEEIKGPNENRTKTEKFYKAIEK